METEQITFRDIDAKQIIDFLSDNEAGRIMDQDEEIVYDEIIWDQQNVRLKKENIILDKAEIQLLYLLNKGVKVSEITEIEKMRVSEVRGIFQKVCTKLCVKNQKEAYRRAKDLKLL